MSYSVLRYPEGDLAAIRTPPMPGRETLDDNDAEIVAFLATNPPSTSDGYLGVIPSLQVTNFQMRQALREAGVYQTVDDHLRAPGGNPVALEGWDYANNFFYLDTLLNTVVSDLSLDKRALFALAATK